MKRTPKPFHFPIHCIYRIWQQSMVMNSTWWKLTLDMTEPDTGSLSSRLSEFRRVNVTDNDSDVARRATRVVHLVTGETAWKTAFRTADGDNRFRSSTEMLKLLNHVNIITTSFDQFTTLSIRITT